MQLVDHPFVKFDQIKPIYNFTYPLFRSISRELYGCLDFSELVKTEKILPARTVSLYFHIPFCETICTFCPFQKGAYKHADQVNAYVAALATEIRGKAAFVRSIGGRIRTIYFGGGTPSILSVENIRHLGDIIRNEFDLSSLAEFTFECEPKSVTKEKLVAAREAGANRISFGVQTFTQRFRSLFNITSTSADIENTVKWSQEIIGDVGFDMMYGMHGQTAEELHFDLKRATELQPETINLYPINNIAITPGLHKSYAAQNLDPSSLAHRQVLRLYADSFMRGCGYAPCNGHSYIKGTQKNPLNSADMSPVNHFRYHKYLHGYHDDYVVGFGASAQSILGSLVTRANPNRTEYIPDVQAHGGPKVHYNWVPKDQIASKALCMRLPYAGYVSKDRIDWEAVAPDVKQNLRSVVDAGLVIESQNDLQLTRLGWQWYSNLMFYMLPQPDKDIINNYVAEMMNVSAVLDGATDVCSAA